MELDALPGQALKRTANLIIPPKSHHVPEQRGREQMIRRTVDQDDAMSLGESAPQTMGRHQPSHPATKDDDRGCRGRFAARNRLFAGPARRWRCGRFFVEPGDGLCVASFVELVFREENSAVAVDEDVARHPAVGERPE